MMTCPQAWNCRCTVMKTFVNAEFHRIGKYCIQVSLYTAQMICMSNDVGHLIILMQSDQPLEFSKTLVDVDNHQLFLTYIIVRIVCALVNKLSESSTL